MKIQGKFIAFFVAILPFACLAIDKDIKLEQLEKEFTILARENNTETVKNYCIEKWSDPKSIEINSKFSTVAEFCTCAQDEMNYLIQDTVSVNLLKIQMQNAKKSPNQYLTEEEIANTTKQWLEKYSIADRACREKFMRRKK